MKFQRESIIDENTKVTDNICWFNGTVWTKVEDSMGMGDVSGGSKKAIEPDKFCLRSIEF